MPTRGKVVLVPFPFDDLSGAKVRPAVCLTEPVAPHGHIVVAFITSQVPCPLANTDVVLDATHPRFAATGLRARSTVRLHRLATLSAGLIRRQLGTLPPEAMADVERGLRTLFGLP